MFEARKLESMVFEAKIESWVFFTAVCLISRCPFSRYLKQPSLPFFLYLYI